MTRRTETNNAALRALKSTTMPGMTARHPMAVPKREAVVETHARKPVVLHTCDFVAHLAHDPTLARMPMSIR